MVLVWLIFGSIVAVLACPCDGKVFGNPKPLIDGRIFSGKEAQIEDFSYQISFEYNSKAICGGSIIHQKVILTAAHCTEELAPKGITVRAGSANRLQGGQIRKVAKVINHEEYFHVKVPIIGNDIVDYDIALLILADSFVWSNKINPIALASKNPAVGELLVVSGWGYTYSTTERPNVLQTATLPVSKCGLFTLFKEHFICAGFFYTGNSEICKGDSGGPLVKNGRLYGIVSSTSGNCKGSPARAKFTSVPVFREWIDKKLVLELN